MSDSVFSTDNKIFLREEWNKPLLKFLTKNIDSKLIYMGLPSPDADDIKQWLEFIQVVIAFQCRKYNSVSSADQDREDVEKLEQFLLSLERENKIESYVVYDGYLEEVVLRGLDNSPQRIKFEVSDVITLYNLDFCNSVASPIEYVDEFGDLKKVYKFDAIKKIIELQRDNSELSNRFIFQLTVHCNYHGSEIQSFLNNPPTKVIKDYLTIYNRLKDVEKNSRIVRIFVTYLIHQQFLNNNFTPKILPVIRYNGIGGTPLLHFVIVGIKTESAGGSTPIYQNFEEIIDKKFVDVLNSEFLNSENILESEKDVNLNPVQNIANSKTFEKLWR